MSNCKKCFVVSPIGENGSNTRVRADKILNYVISPVCSELGYEAYRADQIFESGLITHRVISEIIDADLVIADLSEHNPNVFYELAIRHFIGKPIVQLIEVNERLPFDVVDVNTIKVDHRDLDSVHVAKGMLTQFIKNISPEKQIDNPITSVLDKKRIRLIQGEESNLPPVQELESLIKKVVEELSESRNERQLLFNKVMETESVPNLAMSPVLVENQIDVSGSWNSNHGVVVMKQKGGDVFGEYKFKSISWVGDFIGKIVGQSIIFKWKEKKGKLKGIGYWDIKENKMKGAWFYERDISFGYEQALENPSSFDSVTYDTTHSWNLERDK
ncbi:hypothetical protein ACFL2V_20145 [Pseudomonadota bacterium]